MELKKQENRKIVVQNLKALTSAGTAMSKRFAEVLGDRAPSFLASVFQVVNNNKSLQDCKPNDILMCAMQSASLDLSVHPGLGQAAIVPYGNVPQFQLMWKGIVQLALRSGQYQSINCGVVFKDEFKGYDILSGNVKIETAEGGLRDKFTPQGSYKDIKEQGVVGAFCYFKLINGYEKMVYWPIETINLHGKTYSKTYSYDLSKGACTSMWSKNFYAMALKTLVKNTLLNWGPLSIEMQNAFNADQAYIDQEGNMNYVDNPLEMAESNSNDVPEEPKPTGLKAAIDNYNNQAQQDTPSDLNTYEELSQEEYDEVSSLFDKES